jgi:hypothetical protein
MFVKKYCGGHALKILIGMMVLGLLLIGEAGDDNSYEYVRLCENYRSRPYF